jgi:DNA-binding CsgD family transcriptional regulator
MIQRALELDPPLQHRAQLRIVRAWLLVWQGRLDEADALLAEFRSMIGPEQPSPQYALGAIRTDAEHALALGDPDRAWADLQHFLVRPETYYAPLVFPVLAVAAAAARQLDDRDGGRQRTAHIRSLFDTVRPTRIRQCWEPIVLAELSDKTEDWRHAYGHALGRNVPAHLAPYAGLRLARHLTAVSDRAEAKAVLAGASERAEELGAGLLIDRLQTLARQLGLASAPAPTSDGSAFGDLTPRELEVLRLVAEGRSNGEIGAALFISTKTASVHVSNILAKLRVSSRGEAAALAHRHGLIGV